MLYDIQHPIYREGRVVRAKYTGPTRKGRSHSTFLPIFVPTNHLAPIGPQKNFSKFQNVT